MEQLDLLTRFKAMIFLSSTLLLIIAISSVFTSSGLAIFRLFFDSVIFQIVLPVVMWFAAPVAVKLFHVDTKRNITVLTILIVTGGLLLIAAELLIVWFIS